MGMKNGNGNFVKKLAYIEPEKLLRHVILLLH